MGAAPGEWPVAVLVHEDAMPQDAGLDFSAFLLAVARREIMNPSILALPLTFRPRANMALQT